MRRALVLRGRREMAWKTIIGEDYMGRGGGEKGIRKNL